MIWFVFLISLAGCSVKKVVPIPDCDMIAARERITMQADRIDGLLYPNVKYGKIAKGSLYWSEPSSFLFDLSRFSKSELEIGMNSSVMWFWMRSYDPRRAYSYTKEETHLLNQIFRPDIASCLLCTEIKHPTWQFKNGILIATTDHGDFKRVIHADAEKIIRIFIIVDSVVLLESKVIDYNVKDSMFVPRRISIDLPEDGIKIDVELGDVEINPGHKDPSSSKDIRRLSDQSFSRSCFFE